MKRALLLLLILLAFGAIYAILQTGLSAPAKFFAALIILAISAEGVSRLTGLRSEWGIILLRTKKGIELIKELAKREELWKFIADLGIGLAFGFLGYFAIKRPPFERVKILLCSALLTTFLIVFVAPFVFPFLSISLGLAIGGANGASAAGSVSNAIGPWIIGGALYIGGFTAMVTISLVSYGVVVLSAVVNSVFFGSTAMAQTSPGVTLLLPGINLPLVEGILALFIILVVHEGSHAILAVIGRIPLISSGVALFGVIPVGAFVEPDQKRLEAKPKDVQTRVIVAGSTANLIAAAFFFILLFSFLYISDPFKEKGWLVVSGMENGTVIHSVNGIQLSGADELNLTPNSTAILETNKGTFEKQVGGDGKIGVHYLPLSYAPLTRYNFFPLDFIFRLLALTFCLNFIIGIVNLLPLPFFDGYTLLELNLPFKWLTKLIMYVCVAAFLMNFLPWLF